jgi:hypothetical protein
VACPLCPDLYFWVQIVRNRIAIFLHFFHSNSKWKLCSLFLFWGSTNQMGCCLQIGLESSLARSTHWISCFLQFCQRDYCAWSIDILIVELSMSRAAGNLSLWGFCYFFSHFMEVLFVMSQIFAQYGVVCSLVLSSLDCCWPSSLISSQWCLVLWFHSAILTIWDVVTFCIINI